MVKKARKVKREQMVVDHLSLYLIMHLVLQVQVIYGGTVKILIYMFIMVMVILISGFLLLLTLH